MLFKGYIFHPSTNLRIKEPVLALLKADLAERVTRHLYDYVHIQEEYIDKKNEEGYKVSTGFIVLNQGDYKRLINHLLSLVNGDREHPTYRAIRALIDNPFPNTAKGNAKPIDEAELSLYGKQL
ncbi:hypothetical protein [Larkinella terrae]|uniref:Uncharacterized protein n=1 Tax=Larkinella terrae TaxID=2025311 RepID=A0A7K0EJU9_9BACT|nr:hypothetical protein [Larkinella terrae]MRS61801.1 hypothetical protein [Larkinella terrae]